MFEVEEVQSWKVWWSSAVSLSLQVHSLRGLLRLVQARHIGQEKVWLVWVLWGCCWCCCCCCCCGGDGYPLPVSSCPPPMRTSVACSRPLHRMGRILNCVSIAVVVVVAVVLVLVLLCMCAWEGDVNLGRTRASNNLSDHAHLLQGLLQLVQAHHVRLEFWLVGVLLESVTVCIWYSTHTAGT